MTSQKKVYLKDYKPPSYLIPKISLNFDVISSQEIIVTSTMTVIPNPAINAKQRRALVLDGDATFLELRSVSVNEVAFEEYQCTKKKLTLSKYSTETTITIVTAFNPSKNLSLEGIYLSDTILCSQNEPEGFRRITYFCDRPDVMSLYTVSIVASKKDYPTLLSNGNKVSETSLDMGRHQIVWEDPFPKPSYLFAFVAGDLVCVQDKFLTMSDREILLEIYVDHGNEPYTHFAMESLKRSMKWDEDHYGREYDLDRYMIVAVDAFNMGAMENKGLNIFNTQYVLGDFKTATDSDIQGIDRVIAHEYFHNWTGNRITLRDWFQLTLKEGLTVFRDQQYGADQHHETLKRIEEVSLLRKYQFVEDAGPMAHPIRPESFVEINNFYTVTVYEKGAEIIRLYHTLLGPSIFRKAMDLYFEQYDGQAITTEDFKSAMESASGLNLSQFDAWYSQSGTPQVQLKTVYSKKDQTLIMEVSQSGSSQPVLIPIRLGLVSRDGMPLTFKLDSDAGEVLEETILQLTEAKQVFVFYDVKSQPIVSSFRHFSAPVYVQDDLSKQDKLILFKSDTDAFNQWNSGQQLFLTWMRQLNSDIQSNRPLTREPGLLKALGALLLRYHSDPALTSACITLPSVTELLEAMPSYDVIVACDARDVVMQSIAFQYESLFKDIYLDLYSNATSDITIEAMDRRRLQNLCLRYLCELNKAEYQELAYQQFSKALTMTDQLAALSALVVYVNPLAETALARFYHQWKDRPLVMNKWLSLQVGVTKQDALPIVQRLETHATFDSKNPNKLRALYGTFSHNLRSFHDELGEGYDFLAEKVVSVDAYNPSIASRLMSAFKSYHRLESSMKQKMGASLEWVNTHKTLSKNTREVLERILN